MSRVGQTGAQEANQTVTDFHGRKWKNGMARDVFSTCKTCKGSGRRKYKGLKIANKIGGIDVDSDCTDCNGLGKQIESRTRVIRRTRV